MFLELKNNQRIEILDITSYIEDMIHIASSEQEAFSILQKITPQSVETIKLIEDDGETIFFSKNRMRINKQPYIEYETNNLGERTGQIKVIITLKEMTDLEKEIYDLQESQEIQDEAIDDLAEVLSELVEG